MHIRTKKRTDRGDTFWWFRKQDDDRVKALNLIIPCANPGSTLTAGRNQKSNTNEHPEQPRPYHVRTVKIITPQGHLFRALRAADSLPQHTDTELQLHDNFSIPPAAFPCCNSLSKEAQESTAYKKDVAQCCMMHSSASWILSAPLLHQAVRGTTLGLKRGRQLTRSNCTDRANISRAEARWLPHIGGCGAT